MTDINLPPTLSASGFTYIPPASTVPLGYSEVRLLQQLPGGRIMALGSTAFGQTGDWDLRATLLEPTGVLATDFGIDGSIVWGSQPDDSVTDLPVDAEVLDSGDLLILSRGLQGSGSSLMVSRISQDGALQKEFGSSGVTLIVPERLGGGWITPTDLKVLPDGNFLVAGTLSDVVQPDQQSIRLVNDRVVVLKLTADGQLQTDFNALGYAVLQGSWSGSPYDVQFLSDDSVAVVLRSSGTALRLREEIRSYSFHDDARPIWTSLESRIIEGRQPGGAAAELRAWALLPSGKVVAVSDNGSRHWAELRLVDGSIDPSFNEGRPVELPLFGDAAWVTGLTPMSDGGCLIRGYVRKWINVPRELNSAFLIRLDAHGQLMRGFGDGNGALESPAKIGGMPALERIFPMADGAIFWSEERHRNYSSTANSEGVDLLVPVVGRFDFNGQVDYSFGGVPSVFRSPPWANPFYEGASPAQLNIFLKPTDPEREYEGSTLSISREGAPSDDDVFVGLGALNFESGGRVLLNGVDIGLWESRRGELRLRFGAGVTQNQVDDSLQRIGYQYIGDSPPAGALDPLAASINLIWTFSDSFGSSTAYRQQLVVNMTDDLPSGEVAIVGELVEGSTLTLQSSLIDPDGPLTYKYYFWYANEMIVPTPGSGVDSPTLTLSAREVGKTISVRVAAFDVFGGRIERTAVAIGTVTAVNHPPLAVESSLVTAEDSRTEGVLTGFDPEGASLTFLLFEAPRYGVASVSQSGVYSYTPNADFFGSDRFTFKASDGSLDSAAATVTITVNAVSDAPIASELSVSTNEDLAKTGTLTATDIDSATLTYAKVSNPTNGTVTVNANGTFTYTPALNFNGTDSFTYKANDGALDSAPATVTITVTPVNDPPTGSLRIEGTLGQGLTVQATLSALADVDGPPPSNQTIRFEWLAEGVVIPDRTSPELTLTSGLTGKTITVRAHFKDGLGTDESITTGPEGPVVPASLAGKVGYWYGDRPVAAAEIRANEPDSLTSKGVTIAKVQSSTDGLWTVPQLDFGSYALNASRTPTAADPLSVTAADVLAALKLSVGRNPNPDPDGPEGLVAPAASPYQLIAAEVTHDGVIRADDALWIMRAALKPEVSPISHWAFVAEGQDLSGISRHATFIDPTPSVYVVKGTTSNWIGILLGDVDGSWNPGVLG